MATLTATGYQYIFVFNDDAKNPYFPLTVKEALNHISSKPVGQQLLAAISGSGVAPDPAGGFKVKIVRPNVTANIGTPGAEGGSRAVAFDEAAAKGGGGSKAACYWNPNIVSTPGGGGTRPAYIGLAHELVHCMHYLLGTMKNSYDEEEKFTVGLAPYDTVAICENAIRGEHGIALRTTY